MKGLEHSTSWCRLTSHRSAVRPIQSGYLHRRVRQDPHPVRSHSTEAKVRLQAGRAGLGQRQGGAASPGAGEGTIKIEMNFLPDVYVP